MFEREVSRAIARYNRNGERFSVLLLSTGQVPNGDPSRVGPLPFLLANQVRVEDSACHLAGRWFGLVLAGASQKAARSVWSRIQRSTEWSPGSPLIQITTAGVAEWNDSYSTVDELVGAAVTDLDKYRTAVDHEMFQWQPRSAWARA